MSPLAEFLVVVGVGALCSLDTVSVAQTMVSRPIVAASLAGLATGNPADGLVVGAILELVALDTMPFGASRYPEWGAAGVVAGATHAAAGAGTAGALALAMLAGLGTAWFGAVSMVGHRERVARIAASLRDPVAHGSAEAVARLHIAAIAADLVRGALVTAVGMLAVVALVPRLLQAWRLPFGPSAAVPIIIGVAVAGSALTRSARASAGAVWLLAVGLAVGAITVVLR